MLEPISRESLQIIKRNLKNNSKKLNDENFSVKSISRLILDNSNRSSDKQDNDT